MSWTTEATPLSTLATMTSRTRQTIDTNKAALTTPFVFPTDAACDSLWKATHSAVGASEDASQIHFMTYEDGLPNDADCRPSGYNAFYGHYYSPAVCPESWTYWEPDTHYWRPSETTAMCCAPDFSLSKTSDSTGWETITYCVHDYGNTDDFIGVFPATETELTSGIQAHTPWSVAWHSSDTSVLPAFITDLPTTASSGWWDPETGNSSDGKGRSTHEDNMRQYGYAIIGSILGVVLMIICCCSFCCVHGKRDSRRERKRQERLRQEQGTLSAWEEARENMSRFRESAMPGFQRDPNRQAARASSQQDAARSEEQRPQMVETPRAPERVYTPPDAETQREYYAPSAREEERVSTPPSREPDREYAPPDREPTPPPPYGEEDGQRWATSDDNPSRWRRGAA